MSGSDSPCVALCSTALGDNVCRGCARSYTEVACWSAYTHEEKAAVWQALPERHFCLELARTLRCTLALEQMNGHEWAVFSGAPCGCFALRRVPQGMLLRKGAAQAALVSGGWQDAYEWARVLIKILRDKGENHGAG
ncbi:DUF1289 domain-containing protein [Craterilacuibacter sp.]|uniref:DUF1289 domain-containing protein n=1 Tax=Craterilacuibacter sp. TaxID=2870909 RepID=UPI003F33E283